MSIRETKGQQIADKARIVKNGNLYLVPSQSGRGKYTAVLMDVQMPEMDGLEATRAIRADAALHDLPVLAMTANAMKADIDACFAAGMNDFITKPIERKALLQTLRRWLPARQTAPAAIQAREPAQPKPTARDGLRLEGIDVAGALERLGLDVETLRRMLLKFGDGQPAVVDALRAAVASGDGNAAARHAHAIAGASGNLGADSLRAAAKALEHAGRDGRTDLADLFTDVETRAAVVFRSIDTLRDSRGQVGTVPEPVPGPIIVPSAARAALERLQAALGDFDLSAASSALAALDGAAMSGAAEALSRLREHVDSYDYEEARALATRLLGQIAVDAPGDKAP